MFPTRGGNLNNVILMSVECEYSIVPFRRDEPVSLLMAEQLVDEAFHRRLANHSTKFLGARGGYATANGGRVYSDKLNEKWSPEIANPEVRDPLHACAYVLAGQQFFRGLADEMEELGVADRVEVHLPGTCLATGRANGMHINLHRSRDLPIYELVPFLVSFPCIGGSGGWSLRSTPPEFVRSPRAELIREVQSSDSSRKRPLIDRYSDPCGNIGARRVQDLTGDATHSMRQLYVRLGASALLLAMIDHWGVSLEHLKPQEPLNTLATWNRNPEVQQAVGGGRLNAFDLQRCLLEIVRGKLDQPDGVAPRWAVQVVEEWECLLDAASDPLHEDRAALDWAVHEELLKKVAAHHRRSWATLPLDDPDWLAVLHWVSTQFTEVGRGAGASLAGELDRRPAGLTDDLVRRLASTPPDDTRAHIRAEFVRTYAGDQRAGAGWDRLRLPEGRGVELPDPFVNDVRF